MYIYLYTRPTNISKNKKAFIYNIVYVIWGIGYITTNEIDRRMMYEFD